MHVTIVHKHNLLVKGIVTILNWRSLTAWTYMYSCRIVYLDLVIFLTNLGETIELINVCFNFGIIFNNYRNLHYLPVILWHYIFDVVKKKIRWLYGEIIVVIYDIQVTAILSLAAACSSAGVVVLYSKDVGMCAAHKSIPCHRFQVSVAMAFVTWGLTAVSSHVMFWILASV
jgi:hypothetical protein